MQHVSSQAYDTRLFCPLTGQDVIDGYKPSPATIFIYCNEMGFVYLTPKFQKIVGAWEAADEELMHDDLFKKLVSLDSEDVDSCVCFTITERGPALEVISFGFDMAAEVA